MSILQKQDLSPQQLQLFQSEMMSRQKNAGVAWLLLLFAGGFGGHRFYLGRSGSAIAMLLTAGGFGLWTLADIFMMNSMLKETNDAIENSVLAEIRLVSRAKQNEARMSEKKAVDKAKTWEEAKAQAEEPTPVG